MDWDALWNFGDPTGTAEKFAEALARTDLTDDERAEGMTQLARTHGLRKQFDEAHALIDDAEPLATSLRAKTRVALERGRTFNSSGRKAEALDMFHWAVETARTGGEDRLEIDAMHMVAIADAANGVEHNRAAIERANELGSPGAKRWLASLNNNLGWSLFDEGDHEGALECFEAALVARTEDGDPGNIAIAEWCVARAFRALGRAEEALAIQRRLATEDGSGYAHEELAYLYATKGEAELAREYAAIALQKLDGQLDEGRVAELSSIAANT